MTATDSDVIDGLVEGFRKGESGPPAGQYPEHGHTQIEAPPRLPALAGAALLGAVALGLAIALAPRRAH
ncbi:MAG TPA: hypothetical protein VN668_09610 [Stellaceae bacterium]|nr:hypothetical protein [Stellaceae bacterium]